MKRANKLSKPRQSRTRYGFTVDIGINPEHNFFNWGSRDRKMPGLLLKTDNLGINILDTQKGNVL